MSTRKLFGFLKKDSENVSKVTNEENESKKRIRSISPSKSPSLNSTNPSKSPEGSPTNHLTTAQLNYPTNSPINHPKPPSIFGSNVIFGSSLKTTTQFGKLSFVDENAESFSSLLKNSSPLKRKIHSFDNSKVIKTLTIKILTKTAKEDESFEDFDSELLEFAPLVVPVVKLEVKEGHF